MQQTAPDSAILARLVNGLKARPGWSFELRGAGFDRGQGSIGDTLLITARTVNSYAERPFGDLEDDIARLAGMEPGEQARRLAASICSRLAGDFRVQHLMPVPPAAYDVRSWRRWLFDQIGLVDRHELCEFFEIDGVKTYAPSHGPGNDPYLIREVGTLADVETTFRGDHSPLEAGRRRALEAELAEHEI